jgi:hypothetical protein
MNTLQALTNIVENWKRGDFVITAVPQDADDRQLPT